MTDATLLTDRRRPAVRLERHLPDPPAVVWKALTEREQLRSWFPSDVIVDGGRWEVGATITFPFPPEVIDLTLTGEVLEVDEPNVLAFTWGEDALRFELTPEGDGTSLVLVDELPTGTAARNASGWEICLDRLAGLEPAPDAWRAHFERYAAAFEPALGPQEGPPAGLQGRSRERGERRAMTNHRTGTREEWLEARLQLLQAEKELTRRGDELAQQRQELPWVRLDKEYRFHTDEGAASFADFFRGRSQLLVYHFMFGPEYTAGCPACSAIADGFDGFVVHLANHDVTLCAVSRAPLPKLQAYKRRMGWSFPWASSFGSDFNYDFQTSFTEEQQQSGAGEYNFRPIEALDEEVGREGPLAEWAATTGTDWATYTREAPGMSAFALEDGVVYHTYSAYARGVDGMWGMYQWLDRAPKGRNETGPPWFRRHDEYDQAP